MTGINCVEIGAVEEKFCDAGYVLFRDPQKKYSKIGTEIADLRNLARGSDERTLKIIDLFQTYIDEVTVRRSCPPTRHD